MTNLELTFTNAFGEIFSLKNVDKKIYFNHSDVHEYEHEWDDIKFTDVVFNEHEKIVISRFSRLVNDIV